MKSNDGTAEIQELTISSANPSEFVLSFDGAKTSNFFLFVCVYIALGMQFFNLVSLAYGATAIDVQRALNDLPTLATEGVIVTSEITPESDVKYRVKFTANRGLLFKILIRFYLLYTNLFNLIRRCT